MLDEPGIDRKFLENIAERFDLALWATDSAIWDWDIEAKLLWSSPGHQHLFKRGDGELTEKFDIDDAGNSWASQLPPEDRARTVQRIRDHLENDTPYDIEYRYRLPNGEYLWIRSVGRALRDSDGRALRMVGSNSDITTQKLAEIDTQRFREAVDNASEGFALYDADERFVYANKRWRELYPGIAPLLKPGARRKDIRHAFYTSGAVPAAVGRVKKFVDELQQRNRTGETTELQLANGTWIKLSDHLLPDGSIVSVRTDITDIRQREEELRESEQTLSHHITRTPLAAIVWNVDGTVREWNPAAEKIFGYKAAEAVGRSASDLVIFDADKEHLTGVFRGLLEQKGGESTFNENVTKDGSSVFVEWYNTPLLDSQGKTTGIASLALDVTERKKAEDALRESEERFRTLIEHAPEAITLLDVDTGLYVDANPMAEVLHGLSREELVEKVGPEDLSPEIQPDGRPSSVSAADYLNQALAGEYPKFEWMHLTPDGEEALCEVHLARLPHAHRKLVRASISDITERKKAENALRESEARLNQAQRIAHIGSWEYNSDTGDLTWSDEVYRIFGVRRDEFELTVDSFHDAVHPEDRSVVRVVSDKEAFGIKDYAFEHRIVRPDGEVRTVREVVLVSAREGGVTTRRSGTVQDITEQASAEAALRENEADLARAQKISHIGSWTWDIATDQIHWSVEHYRILGLDPKGPAASYKAFLAMIHQDDREAVKAAVEEALRSQSMYDFQYRIIRSDGEIRTAHTIAEVEGDEAGRPIRMSGTFQDITERTQIEEALRESEQMLRGIFETAAIGITVNDREGRFIQTNPAYQKMLGLTAEELNGKSFWDITHPDDHRLEEPYFADILAGEIATYHFNKRYLHKDGSTIWVSLNIADLKDADGIGIGSIATVEDITERKKNEQALAKSEAHLNEAQRIAHLGSWEYDERANELTWSDEVYRITGQQKGAFKPTFENILKLIHPEDRPRMIAARKSALEGKSDGSFVYRIVRPNGEIRHIRRFELVSASENGEVIRRSGAMQDITEQVGAERALAESEKSLRLITNNVPALISYVDSERRYRFLNERYQEWLLQPIEEIVGRNVQDVLGSAYYETIEPWITRVLAGERVRFESTNTFSDGKKRYLDIEYVPDMDADSQVKGYYGVINDITERMQAEKVRTQLFNAVENMNDGFAVFDADNRLEYCNSRFRNDYPEVSDLFQPGISHEELLRAVYPHTYKNIGGKELDVEAYVDLGKHVFDSGQSIDFQLNDGRWMRLKDNKLEDGRHVRYRIDISERKKSEAALAESEALLAEAQQIANVGSWVVKYEGKQQVETNWSAQLCRIYGIEETAVPQNFDAYLTYVYEEDRDLMAESWTDAIKSDDPYEVAHRIVRPDGEMRYIHTKAHLIGDPSSSVRLWVGASTDVTERNLAEEELRQAQKMEAIGQLTGGVAHDFNNLLLVIQINLELIRITSEVDDAVNEMIERGVHAVERGSALTHRLLAFSRKQTLLPVTIDVGEMVADMADMLRRTLGETIKINTRGQAGLWLCHADQSQLENALLNLAINARDAMPDGGTLTIETANISLDDEAAAQRAEIEPGHYVVLSVSDTGRGIDSEVLKHVFEPFFTTKGVGKGTGLGLSMVFGFAKQTGGLATINSEKGEGTTVKLYLPRSEERGDESDMDELDADIPVAREGEQILVVEDDADVLVPTLALLSALGYETAEASDAEAALDVMANSAAIDLMLCDVILPGTMIGPDLAAEVQKRSPATKIIYMTGYAEDALDRIFAMDKDTHLL